MDSCLKESIQLQRHMISQSLGDILRKIADRCVHKMDQQNLLEEVIHHAYPDISYCKNLFILDIEGVQITNTVADDGVDTLHFGRDRSHHLYMQDILKNHPELNFTLSEAYISSREKRPSLTAIQAIRATDGTLQGYLGADFDIRELPHSIQCYKEPNYWRQIKGDPAIRGGLFQQQRIESALDTCLDDIFPVMFELFTEQGVFHGEIHFSSSRYIIWQMNDPLVYRLLNIDELTDPDICLAFPNNPYPEHAIVPKEKIMPIFDMFQQLRFADENIYLRSGSLNIINGMVGLNFSCDGSHYIPYNEFLEKSTEFWFGYFL